MSRSKFFAYLRARQSGVFGTRLSQAQVEGIEAILDSARRNEVHDPDFIANILAQVYHETGGYMLPIKETVYPSHTDKNPSDATVIARLDRAWAKGQLPWVRKPYWREGWFGRGPIQITHEDMYRRMGIRLNVELWANRDLALDKDIGADIAVVGMVEGMFRSKKLADYKASTGGFNAYAARAIVNGDTPSVGPKIKDYHAGFRAAIDAAGGVAALFDAPAEEKPPETPVDPPELPAGVLVGKTPEIAQTAEKTGLASILAALFRLIFKKEK